MRAIVFAALLCVTSLPAFAGGSGVYRSLTSTTIRACPAPNKLREHYGLSDNVDGYFESIEVDCLSTPTSAIWIFTAENGCDTVKDCDVLADPAEHVDRATGESPRVMTYRASPYTIEKDCELGNGQNHRGVIRVKWSCKRSRTFEKLIVVKTDGPPKEVDDLGERITRDLTSTTLRPCPTGAKLREHYAVRSYIDSYGEDIEIACLTKPGSAAWIFLAATDFQLCRTCRDKRLPQLAVPTEHRDDSAPLGADLSPAVMSYEASKYLIGDDCTLEAQGLPQWSCRSNAPASNKPLRVQTIGSTKETADDTNDAPKLPFQASEPPARFTLRGEYDED